MENKKNPLDTFMKAGVIESKDETEEIEISASVKAASEVIDGASTKGIHNGVSAFNGIGKTTLLGGASTKGIHNGVGLANGYTGVVKGISDVGIFESKLGFFSPNLKKFPTINLGVGTSLKSIELGTQYLETIIVKYIEGNFETYKTSILEANMFSTQKSIIEESIKAYEAGLYQIATLPLIAAYDNVISRWLKGILNEPYQNNPVYIKEIVSHTKGLRKIKINDATIDEMQKSYDAILIRAIFKMTSNLFITDSEDLTKMNRNSIMHGAFDYPKLDKVSFYKMFSLLKTCLSLSDIETETYIVPYIEKKTIKDTNPVV